MKPLSPPGPAQGRAERTIIVLIVLTTGLGPFTLNVPLPSMPTIASAFEVSYGRVQLILTLYLLALALGQFVYGPLSDRFGRRPVLITGLAVFILGSLLCAAAPTIDLLLVGRFIQGFGACAGIVLGRAMLSDLYGRDRAASLIGYVTMAMVTAPMIAPALGGVIDEYVGWRAGFVILVIIGVALLWMTAARLPETNYEPMAGAGIIALLRGCLRLFATPAFLAYGTMMAFTSAMFFSFLAGAPLVVVELMGRSPIEYGLWFAVSAASYMVGNFLSGRYAYRIGAHSLMRAGVILALVGVGAQIIALSLGPFVPAALFLPMIFIALGNGLVLPSAIASAVTLRADLAGAASGLSGALQMGTGAAATVVVAVSLRDTATPMVMAIALCGLVSAAGYMASRRYQ